MRSLQYKLLLLYIILLNACLCGYSFNRNNSELPLKVRVCAKRDLDYKFNGSFTSLEDFVKKTEKETPSPFIVSLIEGSDNIIQELPAFLLNKIAYLIMIAFGVISLLSMSINI